MQRDASNTQGPSSAQRLIRAALLGLSGGLLLGGLFLASTGLVTRLKPADCLELSEEECTFVQDTAREMGRVQLLSGAALLALGLATVVLVLRPKSPSSTERPG